MSSKEVVERTAELLVVPIERAAEIVSVAGSVYTERMKRRFSKPKFRERVKRTNPFLIMIRGINTVDEWAENQVRSTLFASEEEAVGHLIETIAKMCFPGARKPTYPDDFDLEHEENGFVQAFQIKMSWDCMPMSSRKNLSNTVRKVSEKFATEGKRFEGVFAPAYGKPGTTQQPGQAYVSMGSSEFWTRVGGGREHYDTRVGLACAAMCSDFRRELMASDLPQLMNTLAEHALASFGRPDRSIDFDKLCRLVNKVAAEARPSTSPELPSLLL